MNKMKKATKITLSKIIKLPIEGVSFSNKQIGVEIEYNPDVDLNEAADEMNQILTILKEDDPQWIADKKIEFPKQKNQINLFPDADVLSAMP